MYGIFTYIWVLFRVNVVKYSIHGAYGYGLKPALYFGFWKTTRPRQSPSNPAQPTAPTIATKHTAGVVAAGVCAGGHRVRRIRALRQHRQHRGLALSLRGEAGIGAVAKSHI